MTILENVLVDSVFYRSTQPDATPFFFNNLIAKNVRITNVCANTENLTQYLSERSDSEPICWK